MLCRLSVARGMSERAFVIFRLAIFPFFFCSYFFSVFLSLSFCVFAFTSVVGCCFFLCIFGLAMNNYSCRMCEFIHTNAHTHTRDLTIRSFWKVSNFFRLIFSYPYICFLLELNKNKCTNDEPTTGNGPLFRFRFSLLRTISYHFVTGAGIRSFVSYRPYFHCNIFSVYPV